MFLFSVGVSGVNRVVCSFSCGFRSNGSYVLSRCVFRVIGSYVLFSCVFRSNGSYVLFSWVFRSNRSYVPVLVCVQE